MFYQFKTVGDDDMLVNFSRVAFVVHGVMYGDGADKSRTNLHVTRICFSVSDFDYIDVLADYSEVARLLTESKP